MAAPHNKGRYGEIWPSYRITYALEELRYLRDRIILSGGWAWHFMSPEGHKEYKHAHDHKDIDVFVRPEDVAEVVTVLKARGFEKVWTKYDKHQSDEDFRRYEKSLDIDEGRTARITIDFFVSQDISYREVKGWNVVEPEHLLGLYRNIHSSDKCFAVQAAVKMIESGEDPVDREELVKIPSGK
jgi:hypothetical protein